MGAANLNFMDQLFSDHLILGLAAYNAGQGNVKKWLPKTSMPAARWIETMPFQQTRNYVKHILAYLVIYKRVQLSNHTFRISDVMPEIKASK